MDAEILPAREHACKLVGISVTEGTKYQSTETEQKLKWTWEGLQFRSPEGKAGIISVWTGFFYGSAKAKLTSLYDSIFGRSLTEQEARRVDPEKMVGVVQCYVMVVPHRKQDGTMTVKFGGFRVPDNRPPYNPSDFYRDGGSAPSPVADFASVEADDEELSDPFAE